MVTQPIYPIPLVAGALAWLECSLTFTYDGGDRTIFLGEVLDVDSEMRTTP